MIFTFSIYNRMDTSIFTKDGKYLMLALDHRGSFKKYVNFDNPEEVGEKEIIRTKQIIIEALQDQFSGVLLDPDWGLPAYKKKKKPYLLCLEKTGYSDEAGERLTKIQYSAEDLKKMGASGTKLLIYFNPEATNCINQIQTAKKAIEDSRSVGLPLFLEIVTYGNEELNKSRAEWVLRSLKMFIKNNVISDVWKLEYPGDAESCKKITALAGPVPWILLTRGESFDVFKQQFKDAVEAGAMGFLAGRALWQDVSRYKGEEERKDFLRSIVVERFNEICEIVYKA